MEGVWDNPPSVPDSLAFFGVFEDARRLWSRGKSGDAPQIRIRLGLLKNATSIIKSRRGSFLVTTRVTFGGGLSH